MEAAKKSQTPPRSVIEVVDFCREHNLHAELVGKWVWVEFDYKPDRQMRDRLKAFGFIWSARRGKWAHNCGHPTQSAHQSNPWDKYTVRPIHPSA